jgi:hypothetical protein
MAGEKPKPKQARKETWSFTMWKLEEIHHKGNFALVCHNYVQSPLI